MEKPFLLGMEVFVGSTSHSSTHHIDGVSLKCDGVYSILSMQFILTIIIDVFFHVKRGFQCVNLRVVSRLIEELSLVA
jgi:hypothetical protein